MNGVELRKLGTFSEMKYGKMPKKDRITEDGQYPIYSGYRIVGYYDEYNLEQPTLIVVARGVGGTGDVKISPAKCYLTNLSIYVDVDESVALKEYLYYYFQIHNLRYLDSGSAQSQITIADLKNVKVPIPTLETQDKVVSILKSLDNKIVNNEAINRNLEEQAKLLYKSWFIDFQNTENEMPSDWRIGTTEEIIELHDSVRIPLSGNEREKLEKIYPYYGATSVMDYVDNYLFDGIYLLLGEDGSVIDTNGYPILQYVFGKFWVNNHAHVITGKNGFSVEELYLLFSLTNVQNIVTGAVQLKINQGNLKSLEVVIPSEKALKEFDEMIQPMFGKIRILRSEIERLIALRDSLLPKLMSGELDVSGLEI
ncbi:restriction endonuclease subunit S [Listeria monocytogenes]|nr:restriction endonuclease subunit S [Listeria monocytogenes]MDA6038365.1 restriction endonuclease subunit S [Listeria monocytogenes]